MKKENGKGIEHKCEKQKNKGKQKNGRGSRRYLGWPKIM